MEKRTIKTYTEVMLDNNGLGFDRSYKNPLTKVYQYEYALFLVMASHFSSVRCQSMCVESLKLYFAELPHRNENADNNNEQNDGAKKPKTKSQETILEAVEQLVSRDVMSQITFPQMSICAAEVLTILEEDGTHSFIFTDGIYGFRLHILVSSRKGHSARIEVEDYTSTWLVEEKSVDKSSDGSVSSVVA